MSCFEPAVKFLVEGTWKKEQTMEGSNSFTGKSDSEQRRCGCIHNILLRRVYSFRTISNLLRITLVTLIISTFLISPGKCATEPEIDDRLSAIHQRNFGCENLGELSTPESEPPRTSRSRRPTPQCGCGYWGKRIFVNDQREEPVRNVTVTTLHGNELLFECKQCRLCMGRKVASQCKPKQDTLCSEECENPCYEYNSFMKKCLPSRTLCQQETTTQAPEPTLEPVPETTLHIGPPAPTVTEKPVSGPDPHPPKTQRGDDGAEVDLHPWLVAATVVIAFAIIAVLGIIIYVVRTRKQHGKVTNSSTTLSLETPCLNEHESA